MPVTPRDAALGLHRFGFGPRPNTVAAVASDPCGALVADIEGAGGTSIADQELLSTSAAMRVVYESDAQYYAREKIARLAGLCAEQSSFVGEADDGARLLHLLGQPDPHSVRHDIHLNEAKARFDAAVTAEIGFAERWVWFWSNHFCVHTDLPISVGAYEREAIRPHVLGSFADLLLAVVSHPAMLLYLDNVQSVGPTSVGGINGGYGLNENLAREILELHTLGVRSGYSQADVTSLANVLTGWTIVPIESSPEHGGVFVFHRLMHEPRAQIVIDKAYADKGVEQGRSVLADLARHPATAKHIGTKLAKHFISDAPPPTVIDRLARCFQETDGNLKELAKCLVTAPEAWAPDQTKIKKPSEWLVAILRATGVEEDIRRIVGSLIILGEPLWRPPAPNGFADDNGEWRDGMPHRLDVANDFALRHAAFLDPGLVADRALGALLLPCTRRAIETAESKAEALITLLMAPEFQKR
jgi:uncharacterized protein (DUF1800 family)